MNNTESNTLKWRFDVSTFRLIGRDLITDRITALFELVKNCYDANATRVDVIFENVSSKTFQRKCINTNPFPQVRLNCSQITITCVNMPCLSNQSNAQSSFCYVNIFLPVSVAARSKA